MSVRIDTERLLLRPIAAQDFEPWAAFMADAESSRFIGGPQPRALAWRSFLTMAGAWAMQGFSMFSVIEKASGRWIGRVGPWAPVGWPGTEVGWGLVRDATGRGYASEAATAAIDWAFSTLDWHEVIHCIEPTNVNSARIAARLGSRVLRQAALPAPFDDKICDVWGQSRAEWRARRS